MTEQEEEEKRAPSVSGWYLGGERGGGGGKGRERERDMVRERERDMERERERGKDGKGASQYGENRTSRT